MKRCSMILACFLLLFAISSAVLAETTVKFGYNTGDCIDDGWEADLSSIVLNGAYTLDAFKAELNLARKDLDDFSTLDYEIKLGYDVVKNETIDLYPTLGYMRMSANYEGDRESTTAIVYGLGLTCHFTDDFSASAFFGKGTHGKIHFEDGDEDDSSDIKTYDLELNYQFSDRLGMFVNYRKDSYEIPYGIEWDSYGAGVIIKF